MIFSEEKINIRKYFICSLTIGTNLVPLVGLLLWNWDVLPVFTIYWAENMVIALCTMVMMCVYGASRSMQHLWAAVFSAIVFAFMFGIFSFFQLMFVTSVFVHDEAHRIARLVDYIRVWFDPELHGVLIVAGVMGLLQIVNCVYLYLTRYAKSPDGENIAYFAFGRLIVLQFAIMIAGIVVIFTGEHMALLLPFIGLKAASDILVLKKSEER